MTERPPNPTSEPPVEGLTSKTATRTGHTPGPWEWRGSMLWNEALDTVVLNHAGCDWRVRGANAHLIAAAPRLKASLVKTLAAAVELHAQGIGCPDCPEDHEDTGEDCPMLQEAEAAIRAAEGRS